MNWIDIIALCISVGALIVSIVTIIASKKQDDDRAVKDMVIGELDAKNGELISYITPLTEKKFNYSCQSTVSWFKFYVMRLEAITQFVQNNFAKRVDRKYSENVVKDVHDLRTTITDSIEFQKHYNDTTFALSDGDIVEIEQKYKKTYEDIMILIGEVNS